MCICVCAHVSVSPFKLPSSLRLLQLLRVIAHPSMRGVPVVALVPRPRAEQVLVVAQQNYVRLFDSRTWQPIRSFAGAVCTRTRVPAAFSPDGNYILCGSEDGSG